MTLLQATQRLSETRSNPGLPYPAGLLALLSATRTQVGGHVDVHAHSAMKREDLGGNPALVPCLGVPYPSK